MTDQSLRLLLCGGGRVAERYYGPALRLQRRFRVSAVVDPAAERREAFAHQLGAGHYASVAAACAAESFDVALVLTPPQTQPAVARELLEAGLPVLIEKPGASSRLEALGLLEVAADLPLRLALARRFWRRYRDLRSCIAGVPDGWSVAIETNPRAWRSYVAAIDRNGVASVCGRRNHLMNLRDRLIARLHIRGMASA